MKLPIKALARCVGSCAVLTVGSAQAYSLDLGNSALSGITGPYGSVDVSLSDPTHAVITFTAGVVDGKQFLFGADGTADFNVNATSFTATFGSFSQLLGFSAPTITSGGSGNVSSFGVFNQTFNGFDGFTHATTTLTFNVTDTSGTWASPDNVLAANASGYSVAAHIFVTPFPGDANNTASVTGFAADGSPTVPDGGTTAAMLGAALSVFGLIRRKLN
jgi:hypothetical protein